LATFGTLFLHASTTLAHSYRLQVHQKYLNYHGQPCARLCRDQSVHSSAPPERTLLIKLFSPLLFFAPDVHLRALEDIWVDEMVCHVPWKDFMTKMNDDWERYVLFVSHCLLYHYITRLNIFDQGTVILNGNVGFLAIGTFNASGAASIASYLSTIASCGSIIIGLLLFRHNKTKNRNTADAAVSD
jgi:hypothetical protein